MVREPSFPCVHVWGISCNIWRCWFTASSGKGTSTFHQDLRPRGLSKRPSHDLKCGLCVRSPWVVFFKGGYTQKDISNKKTLGSQEGSKFLIPTLSFKILPSYGIQKSTGTQLPNLENDSARIRKPQHLLLNHTSWRDTEVDCTEKKKIPTLTCFYFSLIKKKFTCIPFFFTKVIFQEWFYILK